MTPICNSDVFCICCVCQYVDRNIVQNPCCSLLRQYNSRSVSLRKEWMRINEWYSKILGKEEKQSIFWWCLQIVRCLILCLQRAMTINPWRRKSIWNISKADPFMKSTCWEPLGRSWQIWSRTIGHRRRSTRILGNYCWVICLWSQSANGCIV